jgi:aminocarboxymuconate-semialdehyde decarboxylase
MFIREGIRSIEDLDVSDEDREKLYLGNALRLMRMPRIGQ